MRNINSSLLQSQYFLPVQSMVNSELFGSITKSPKKRKPIQGKSLLFDELKKVSCKSIQNKRDCIIKYLKKQGQLKDTSKIISTIQKEGHAIPYLQVAVALTRYDNHFLKQLLDPKSIELKETKQSQIYQLNKKLQSNPILSLLSDSEQLKKLPQQIKQPSFLDFKLISPTKITELIDYEKGKLKKSKSKGFSMIEYPKELTNLKKELFSLPYINRYKKELNLKKKLKQQRLQFLGLQNLGNCSNHSQINHVSDLNTSKDSFEKATMISQNNLQLEKNLRKALERRVKNLRISEKDVSLPKLQKHEKSYLSRSLMQIKQGNLISHYPLQNQDNYQQESIRQTQNNDLNPEDQFSTKKNSLSKKQTIKQTIEEKYWPVYHNYSPHNNKKYVSDIENLKAKVMSLTQLQELPSEQTLGVYYSLKRLEKNDIKKLQKQSLHEQTDFSNTKYKIKFKNLKENYSKRLKQFSKDKKVRQFQLQQSSYLQQSNLSIKQIKMNSKMLQKIILPKREQS